MPVVLTRETMAAVVDIGVNADSGQVLTLDLARGNVAVINQIIHTVYPDTIADTVSDGAIGLSLDAGLAVGGDVTDLFNDTDDADLENNAAILYSVPYKFIFEEDSTNGVGIGALQQRQGISLDYRRLPLLSRPFTSENPEALIDVSGSAFNVTHAALIWYQVVRLDQGELERLVPSGLGPSARIVRFPAVPTDDPMRQPVIQHLA